MSSRLFQIVREKYGLAYSVQSSTGFFADTGAFVVSAGMDHKYLERASRLIMREIRRIAAKPPSQEELDRARNYAVGQMKLSMDSTSSQMMWVGENLLSYGTVPEPAEIERRVQAVTRENVHAVAADLFRDSRWNIAVIGPVKNQQKIESAFA
jgi:predicted Zn-dependent peptidase